jgi:hypothetical protein
MLTPRREPGISVRRIALLSLLATGISDLHAQVRVDNPVERIELASPSLETMWITSSAEKPIRAARDVSLTIQVTDITGAVIPGAHVTLISNDATQTNLDGDTDENGRAVLSVNPGGYRLSVSSPGFFKWRQQIDVQDAASRKVEVKLTVGSCPPGPCVTVGPAQQWLNDLMPTSPPTDSIWIEEQ